MTKKVMREANLRAVKDPFREEMAVEKAYGLACPAPREERDQLNLNR